MVDIGGSNLEYTLLHSPVPFRASRASFPYVSVSQPTRPLADAGSGHDYDDLDQGEGVADHRDFTDLDKDRRRRPSVAKQETLSEAKSEH